MTKDEAFRLASSFYLTTYVPVGFYELSERAQLKFIDDHIWEPLETWHAYDVLDLIDEAAEDILNAVNNNTN